MKRTNIFFALLTLVALTIFGCQKDSQVTPDTKVTVAAAEQQILPDQETCLVFIAGDDEPFKGEIPAFDLESFQANYRPINIYEKFDIAEEDLSDLAFSEIEDSRSTVILPAGSVDGLADAIEEAGYNGKVIVESGIHYESARVVITEKVTIVGQEGAVIETSAPSLIPALHIKNAHNVTIKGLELRSTGPIISWAILVENSDLTTIEDNVILGYNAGIVIEQGDHTKINQNTMVGSGLVHNIIVVNGEHVKILGNDLSNARFGIFISDKKGHYKYNTTHGNLIGVVMCKVPQNNIPLPDGGAAGADFAATEWKVQSNDSHGNVQEGYLLIDGSNNNLVKQNTASGNGTYAIQLQGDSYRFGFFTPAVFENTVNAYDDMTVKDCGIDNTVTGGILVDTDVDECD